MTDEDFEIPEYPFFEVDGPTAAFGCSKDKYVDRRTGSLLMRHLRKEADIFSSLFFSGGRLEDHGIRFKQEYVDRNPLATIRALMCSFEPSHEAKTGTVALAFYHWCEDVGVDDEN